MAELWTKSADPIANCPVEWEKLLSEITAFGAGVENTHFSAAFAVTAHICRQQQIRSDEGTQYSCLSLLEDHLVKTLPHFVDVKSELLFEDGCKNIVEDILMLSKKIGCHLYQDESVLRSTLEQIANKSMTITFFGSYNTGKSTVLNSLIGDEILPMNALAQTSTLVKLKQNGTRQLPRLVKSDGCSVVIGTKQISEELERIDDKIKDSGCEESQEILIEVDIPCAARVEGHWSLMLVDTPGFDATPHQSLVESIKLGVKSSPAYIYCVEFDKIQSKTSQEHYIFLHKKCRDIFEQGRLLIMVTRYDQNLTARRRLTDAKVKAVVCSEIKKALGMNFPEEKIVLVSGKWALCARLLQCTSRDEDLRSLLREAKGYIEYCSTAPSGQGKSAASLDLPQQELARHIEEESGIKKVESWIEDISAPDTLTQLRDQNFQGDCCRYITDAREILMTILNCFNNLGDELAKFFDAQLNVQQTSDEIQQKFKNSTIAEDSCVYKDLQYAYDEDTKVTMEDITVPLKEFKTGCNNMIANRGWCKKEDFERGLEKCLRGVTAILERKSFLHVSKCFSKFAGEFGYKLQLLIQNWQSYCNIQHPLNPGDLSWPTGLLNLQGVGKSELYLSDVKKALRFPEPQNLLERLKQTILRRQNRLTSENVEENLALVEENVNSECRGFFEDAKEEVVKHFFETGYCARVLGELDTMLSSISNDIARKDEKMKMWKEIMEISDASKKVITCWIHHLKELEKFLEDVFPHKVLKPKKHESIASPSVHTEASPTGQTKFLRTDSVKTLKDTISTYRNRGRSNTLPRPKAPKPVKGKKRSASCLLTFEQDTLRKGREEQYKEWLQKRLLRDDIVQEHLNVDSDLAQDLTKKDFISTCEAAAIRIKKFGQAAGFPPILCDYSSELFKEWKQVEEKKLQIGVIGAANAVVGLLWALTADRFLPDDENDYMKGVRIVHATAVQRGGCLHDDPSVHCEKCPILIDEANDGSVAILCKGATNIQSTLRELNKQEREKQNLAANISTGTLKPTPGWHTRTRDTKEPNCYIKSSCSLLMCNPPWSIHFICQPNLGKFLKVGRFHMCKLDASAIVYAIPYVDGSVIIDDKRLKDLVDYHETLLREPSRVAIVITNCEQCFEECLRDSKPAREVFPKIVEHIRGKFDALRVHVKEEVFLFICEKWAYTARLLKNHPTNVVALKDAEAALTCYNQADGLEADLAGLNSIEVATKLLKASNIKALEDRIQTPMIATCSHESTVRMKNTFAHALESAAQSLQSHKETLDLSIMNFKQQVETSQTAIAQYHEQRQKLLGETSTNMTNSVVYTRLRESAREDANKLIKTGCSECNRLFEQFEWKGDHDRSALTQLSRFINDLLDGAKHFAQGHQCVKQVMQEACADMARLRNQAQKCYSGQISSTRSKEAIATGTTVEYPGCGCPIAVKIAPWKVELTSEHVLDVQDYEEALRKSNLDSICKHIRSIAEAFALDAYTSYCQTVKQMLQKFDEEFSECVPNQEKDMKEVECEHSGWATERERITRWQAHLKDLKSVILMQAEQFLREQQSGAM